MQGIYNLCRKYPSLLWRGWIPLIGLAIILVAIVSALTVVLLRLQQQLQTERGLRQQREREALLVSDMIEGLEGADWQRSLQGVLSEIVQGEAGRAAALLSLAENGALEVRASAYAPEEPVWDDLMQEPALHQALESQQPVQGTGGAAFLPISGEGETVGVLAVRGGDSHSLVLRAAARVCGVAITEIRRHRKQATLTNTDGLTGLANHRHFQQALGVALGQAYLEGEPLAIILMDIDRFKQVNDTYGHLFGDLVLREIAYVLRRSIPPQAVAARYGGEEMVVMLQGQAAADPLTVAERLRRAIADTAVMEFTSGIKLNVTVSMGVAVYQLGEGKNRFIARADEALYLSKREGRNRVTLSQGEGGTETVPHA